MSLEVNGNSNLDYAGGNGGNFKEVRIEEDTSEDLEKNAVEVNLDSESSTTLPIPIAMRNDFLDSCEKVKNFWIFF